MLSIGTQCNCYMTVSGLYPLGFSDEILMAHISTCIVLSVAISVIKAKATVAARRKKWFLFLAIESVIKSILCRYFIIERLTSHTVYLCQKNNKFSGGLSLFSRSAKANTTLKFLRAGIIILDFYWSILTIQTFFNFMAASCLLGFT